MSKHPTKPCAVPPRPPSNNKRAVVTRYRTVSWPGHPLAQADGKVYAHRAALYEKIGPGSHKCAHCGRSVTWDGAGISRLVVDHKDDDRWNNDHENLQPSCRMCNSKRAERADFLTHCANGHEYTPENTYNRPDGKGRQCRKCNQAREKGRIR